MKKYLFSITMMLLSMGVWAQENMFTLSGGYAFANPEQSDKNATGFRINGLYEFNPNMGQIAHGLNVGYVLTKYNQDTPLGTDEFSIRSWPIFYAPKVMLGSSEKFKFFVKGALGMHFSKYSSEGSVVNAETVDTGFYGGAGLGGMFFLKESIFLNLEYEWAYQANSFYDNGYLNSAQLGIGYKF